MRNSSSIGYSENIVEFRKTVKGEMVMKLKNIFFMLLCSNAGYNAMLAVCDETTKKIVINDSKKPYIIYEKIQKIFNPIINKKLNEKTIVTAFEQWEKYTDCADVFINNPAYTSLKQSVKLAKFYTQSVLKKITHGESIDVSKIAALLKAMDGIVITTIREIHREVPMPTAWKDAILSSMLKDLFVDHEQFFKNYEAAKKQFLKHGKNMDTQRIVDYVRNQSFIKKDPRNPAIEQNNINILADSLEKTIIKLEEDKRRAWFGKADMQLKIDNSKEILAALIKQYPLIVTAQMYQKIPLSKNTALLILLAEASSLYSILKRIENYLKK